MWKCIFPNSSFESQEFRRYFEIPCIRKLSTCSTFLIGCLLATLFVYLVSEVRRHRRYYYLGLQLSGTPGWPIFGNSLSFISSSLDHFSKTCIQTYNDNGSNFLFRIWFGPSLCVVPTDVDMVEKILANVLHKAPCYQIMSGSSGQGLIQHMHLPLWAKHRKIIGTSFKFSVLKSYIRIFFEESTILTDKMAPLAISKEPFEPHHLVGLAALNALMRSSFGVDFEIQQNYQSHHPYLEAVESTFQIFLGRIFKPWLLIDFFYTIFGYKAQVKKNRIVQREFIQNTIEVIRNKVKEDWNGPVVEYERHSKGLESFVEQVLRHNMSCPNPLDHEMSDRQLLHEMVTLLNAGFDTVTITISLILYILAIHPNIQQEVFNEIDTVMGNNDATPTLAQLQDLTLLTRVIKEAMRLFPAAPIIARSCPTELECGDYIIPAGATIGIFIYGIHRDPRYWPDPERFDPDRFLPSEVAKRNPNAYLPFSLGARNCIGSKYAMLHMKSTISTLLKRYRILPGAKCRSMRDIKFEFGLTIRLLSGNDIRLEAR